MKELPKIRKPHLLVPAFLILDAVAILGLSPLNPVTVLIGGFVTYWAVRYWRGYWLLRELWRHQNGKCDCHTK